MQHLHESGPARFLTIPRISMRLAENGLRFTQFYNTGKCHSSRISILTGLYPTQAGDESLSRGSGKGAQVTWWMTGRYPGRISPQDP